MSNDHKMSLWQKLKRLLTSRAPQESITPIETHDAHDTQPIHSSVAAITNDPLPNDSLRNNDHQHKDLTKRLYKKDGENDDNSNGDDSNNSDTNIIDYLKLYCRHKHWRYTHYKPKVSDAQQSHYLSLRLKNRQVDCGYLFRVQEKQGLLAIYGILPFLIPETHQSAAMLLMTQINYDLIVGNLEMDMSDGEIRYKNAIDVEATGLDDDIIEHLLQSVIAMTTVAYEIFSDLINTQTPSDDMPTLLSELRVQADARTFFLATKKMQ